MPWIQSNQCAKWLILRWRILVPPLHRENNSLLIYKCVPFVLHLCYACLTARLVGLWSVIYRHKTQGGMYLQTQHCLTLLRPKPLKPSWPWCAPITFSLPSTLILYMAYLITQGDSLLINTTVPVGTCFPTFVALCSSVTITVSWLYYPYWGER